MYGFGNHRKCRGDIWFEAEDPVRFARPEQVAGRSIPAPTSGLTQRLCLCEKRFTSTDLLLRLLPLDALGDRVGYRCKRFRRRLADRFPREHSQNAHDLATGQQWEAGEGRHAFDASPVWVAQARIVDDVVRDVAAFFRKQ